MPFTSDEAVDRHLEHPVRLARLPDEVRQVELVAGVADHADGGIVEDQLAQPEVAAEERGQPQVEIEPVEFGEGLPLRGSIGDSEAAKGDVAAQERDVDGVEARRRGR